MSQISYTNKLMEKYNSGFRQRNECTCGPASVSLVTFAIDGKQRDESEWLDPKFKRWVPVDEFITRGIGLIELLFTSELVLGNGFEVILRRAFPENIHLFRVDLDRMLNEELAIIPNFRQDDLLKLDRDDHKNPHYSPVAAFDVAKDELLIADVDTDILKSYWVPVEKVFQSMVTSNPVFDLPRGWLIVRKRDG